MHIADQVDDVRQVVAWATTHGGDAGCIIIGGSSSGGQLAAIAGLTSGAVQAVVTLYGQFAYGQPTEQPDAFVHQHAPPFLLIHGDRDTLVPAAGTRAFAQRLRSVSDNPVLYAELPYGGHNFDQFHSVRSLGAACAIAAFGAWVCQTAPESP